jgi:hypothetical protein
MSTKDRPTLEEILGDGADEFKKRWNEIDPDTESQPIPPGVYEALIVDGRFFRTRNDKPAFKIALEILAPEQFRGRRVYYDLYLTIAAASITKKELAKLGIQSIDRLRDPLPVGIVMTVSVSLETTDKGNEFNKVVSFKSSTNGTPPPNPLALPGNPSSVDRKVMEGEDIPF